MDFWKLVVHQNKNVPTPDLWYQKYQPRILEEVIGNSNIIRTMEYYLKNKNIPNLIITGRNGVGKKTTVNCLVHQYLGQHYGYSCLRIHGSINRGKDVVSEKSEQKKTDKTYDGPNVINFIKKLSNLPKDLCKITIIYDFDHMTKEAQMALLRVIEIYSEKTRFIFLCNDITNIIEAIQSRCVLLKFSQVSSTEIEDKLSYISEQEGFILPEDVNRVITLAADGDIKQAIGYLQIISKADHIDLDCFYKIFNIPPLESIKNIIHLCLDPNSSCEKCKKKENNNKNNNGNGNGNVNGNVNGNANGNNKNKNNDKINPAYEILMGLIDNGYNVSDILDILLKVIYEYDFPNEKLRSQFITAINQCFYLTETSNSNRHLYYLISELIQIGQNKGPSTHIY